MTLIDVDRFVRMGSRGWYSQQRFADHWDTAARAASGTQHHWYTPVGEESGGMAVLVDEPAQDTHALDPLDVSRIARAATKLDGQQRSAHGARRTRSLRKMTDR